MKQLIRKFKQVLIIILAISFIGCENDDADRPKVVAGFTYTLSDETGTVTFINISVNANTYEWRFIDTSDDSETTSTEINPVHVFETGIYTVILKAKSNSGASDTFEDTITINIPLPVTLPITFDVANVNYNAATFNGASFAVVANPAPGGTNNVASKVGAITNSGAAYEGINFDLGTDIDLATNKTIKMNFWANAPVNLLMKLEKGTSSTPDIIVSHGGTGWEQLSFNFSSSSKYSRLTLFVDGPGTTSGTFYMDDVTQIETPPPPCTPETAQSLLAADFNLTFLTNPSSSIVAAGGAFEWITNPDFAGPLNTSCKVGKVVRDAGLQYANTQINLAAPLNFTTKSGFKMKVWSAAIGTKVTVKLEGGVQSEVTKTTTKANEWEELTFDFASTITGNNKIVLFFNIDSFTTGTFYFDDLKLYGTGSGGGACTPDATQTINAANLNMTFLTDPGTTPTKGGAVNKFFQDNATYQYVDNPNSSTSANNSCKVGKVTKLNVQPWDNIQIDFADKFVFTSGSNFTIKVYSPQSGYKVTLKLEDKNDDSKTSGDLPSTTTTTKTNGWEELTIPVDAVHSGKFNKLVIFFDLATKNGNTYYFDDLKLNLGTGGGGGGGGGSTCPAPPAGQLLSNGGFEANNGDGACWQFNPVGGGTVAVSTQQVNAGTYAAKMTTGTNQSPNLKMEGFGKTLTGGKTIQVSFKYKFTTALGVGSILQVLAFSERDPAGAALHELANADGTPLNTWNTYTKTFVTDAGITQGISLLIQLTGSGNAGAAGVVYIDDVQVTQL